MSKLFQRDCDTAVSNFNWAWREDEDLRPYLQYDEDDLIMNFIDEDELKWNYSSVKKPYSEKVTNLCKIKVAKVFEFINKLCMPAEMKNEACGVFNEYLEKHLFDYNKIMKEIPYDIQRSGPTKV